MANRRNKPRKHTPSPQSVERTPDVVSDDGLTYPSTTPEQRVLAEAQKSLILRLNAQVWERRAVDRGRAGGFSWDRLGALLEVPGETLRRRYGDAS